MVKYFGDISKGCAKVSLLMLNGCCILVAIGAITLCIVDVNSLSQYEDKSLGTSAGDAIIMSTCLLMVAIASFGSVGVIKGNARILYLYVFLLLIMIGLEMMILFYMSIRRHGLELRISGWLKQDFFRNTTDMDVDAHANVWDIIQSTYECCGLNGPEDYMTLRRHISLACCSEAYNARIAYDQEQLYRICIQNNSFYSVGCEKQILVLLKSDVTWFVGFIITCLCVEIAGMLLALRVAKYAINDEVDMGSIRYY